MLSALQRNTQREAATEREAPGVPTRKAGNGSSEVARLQRVGKTRSGETQRATPPVSAHGATTTYRRSRTTAHGGLFGSDRSSGKLRGAGAPGAGSSKPKPRGQRLRKAGSLAYLVLASRVCKTRVTESKPRGQRFTVRNAGQRKEATSKGHQQTRPKPETGYGLESEAESCRQHGARVWQGPKTVGRRGDPQG